MKGLYSGRVIMARNASKGSLTRTQTAAQAYNAIVKKYGEISQAAKYMHKGRKLSEEVSMKQKTGLIGLVSGRLIKNKAKSGEKITRSQSAKQA